MDKNDIKFVVTVIVMDALVVLCGVLLYEAIIYWR